MPATLQVVEFPSVDQLGHTVKVDQQAQEHLVGCGAIFVYTSEVAEDRDAGDVFAVECEDAGGLWTEVRGAIRWRDVAMDMFVMQIVRGSDLSEESSDHLDDLRDRHGADLVLSLRPRLGSSRSSRPHEVFIGETLDVRQALDSNATRGIDFGSRHGLH